MGDILPSPWKRVADELPETQRPVLVAWTKPDSLPHADYRVAYVSMFEGSARPHGWVIVQSPLFDHPYDAPTWWMEIPTTPDVKDFIENAVAQHRRAGKDGSGDRQDTAPTAGSPRGSSTGRPGPATHPHRRNEMKTLPDLAEFDGSRLSERDRNSIRRGLRLVLKHCEKTTDGNAAPLLHAAHLLSVLGSDFEAEPDEAEAGREQRTETAGLSGA